MSEHNTSRRAVLAGAAAATCIAASPATASTNTTSLLQPSALLIEHRRLRGRMIEVRRRLKEFHRDGAGLIPPVVALEDEHGELHDRICENAERILAMPIRSRADVLACIEVSEYEYEGEDNPHARALISAARWMLQGGAHA